MAASGSITGEGLRITDLRRFDAVLFTPFSDFLCLDRPVEHKGHAFVAEGRGAGTVVGPGAAHGRVLLDHRVVSCSGARVDLIEAPRFGGGARRVVPDPGKAFLTSDIFNAVAARNLILA